MLKLTVKILINTSQENEYQTFVFTLIGDENTQTMRLDTRDIHFKSDLGKSEITQDMILEITETIYATLCYPDFVELYIILVKHFSHEVMNMIDNILYCLILPVVLYVY